MSSYASKKLGLYGDGFSRDDKGYRFTRSRQYKASNEVDSFEEALTQRRPTSLGSDTPLYFAIVREWSSHKLTLAFVPEDFEVAISGGSAVIHVLGDVCDGATLFVRGGSASIIVDGRVCDGAQLFASGGSASIIARGPVSSEAILETSGGGAFITRTKSTSPITCTDAPVSDGSSSLDSAEQHQVSAFELGAQVIREINQAHGIHVELVEPRSPDMNTNSISRSSLKTVSMLGCFVLVALILCLYGLL